MPLPYAYSGLLDLAIQLGLKFVVDKIILVGVLGVLAGYLALLIAISFFGFVATILFSFFIKSRRLYLMSVAMNWIFFVPVWLMVRGYLKYAGPVDKPPPQPSAELIVLILSLVVLAGLGLFSPWVIRFVRKKSLRKSELNYKQNCSLF